MPASPAVYQIKVTHSGDKKNSPWAEPKYKHSRKLLLSSVLLVKWTSKSSSLGIFCFFFLSRVYPRRSRAWIGKAAHFPRSLQRRKSGHKQKSFGNLISLWAHLFCSAKWVTPTSTNPAFSVPLRKKKKFYLQISSSPGSFDGGPEKLRPGPLWGWTEPRTAAWSLAGRNQGRYPGTLPHKFSSRRPNSSA